MEHDRRRTDNLTELTERELLVIHTVKIETLCDVLQDVQNNLNRHYKQFDRKVDWKNFKWIIGIIITGGLCLTGYTNVIKDTVAKNTQEIAVHMKDSCWFSQISKRAKNLIETTEEEVCLE